MINQRYYDFTDSRNLHGDVRQQCLQGDIYFYDTPSETERIVYRFYMQVFNITIINTTSEAFADFVVANLGGNNRKIYL